MGLNVKYCSCSYCLVGPLISLVFYALGVVTTWVSSQKNQKLFISWANRLLEMWLFVNHYVCGPHLDTPVWQCANLEQKKNWTLSWLEQSLREIISSLHSSEDHFQAAGEAVSLSTTYKFSHFSPHTFFRGSFWSASSSKCFIATCEMLIKWINLEMYT